MEMTFEQATSSLIADAEEKAEIRGEKKGKIETALSLLKEGVNLELIIKATNLSKSEIQKYQELQER